MNAAKKHLPSWSERGNFIVKHELSWGRSRRRPGLFCFFFCKKARYQRNSAKVFSSSLVVQTIDSWTRRKSEEVLRVESEGQRVSCKRFFLLWFASLRASFFASRCFNVKTFKKRDSFKNCNSLPSHRKNVIFCLEDHWCSFERPLLWWTSQQKQLVTFRRKRGFPSGLRSLLSTRIRRRKKMDAYRGREQADRCSNSDIRKATHRRESPRQALSRKKESRGQEKGRWKRSTNEKSVRQVAGEKKKGKVIQSSARGTRPRPEQNELWREKFLFLQKRLFGLNKKVQVTVGYNGLPWTSKWRQAARRKRVPNSCTIRT